MNVFKDVSVKHNAILESSHRRRQSSLVLQIVTVLFAFIMGIMATVEVWAVTREAQLIGVEKKEVVPEQKIAGFASLSSRRALRDSKDMPENQPTILFSLGKIKGTFGTEVTLPLLVHEVTDLTSANLAIVFDPNVIAEVVNVKRFGLTADASFSSHAKNGILRISMRSKTPINGSGEFALITFLLTSEENSVKNTVLAIAQPRLYDILGRNFASELQRQIEAEHGQVTIVDVKDLPEEPPIVWETTPHDDEPKPPRRGLPIYVMIGYAKSNTGNPIPGLMVSTEDKVAVTNRYGDYQILGLAKGEYFVKAQKSSPEGFIFIEDSCAVGNGKNCRLNFVIDTGPESDDNSVAYGVIMYDDGSPIKGATVKACNDEHVTTTDQTGFFVFIDLPASECAVTAKKGQTDLFEKSCDLGGESNCQLNVTTHLPSPDSEIISEGEENIYSVGIKVRDKLKQPIADVELQIGDIIVTTDDEGFASVTELPEGEYQLIANKAGFQFVSQGFELGNRQLWTELVVTPVTELSVEIVPSLGQKMPKAEQGKHFSFDITAVNGGDKTATNVRLEYELPGGIELVAIQDRNEACQLENEVVMCDLPDLVAGANYNIAIEVKVMRQADFQSVVALHSNEYPVNVAKKTTIVKPYLSVFCNATPSPVVMSGTLSYECIVELNDNAPVKVATGNQLVVTLPKGMRFESSPNDCSTDGLIVTCQPGDLSVVNPSDISSVAVKMDAVLDDPGLIKLVTKAKIMADNQSNHVFKIRTEINTYNIKVDGIILIDLTASMKPQFKAVIAEVKQRMMDGFINGATPFIAIISFRDDNDIKLVTATRDLDVLLKKLGGLKTKGGGMCPEASVEAFILALGHIKPGGTIMLVTDAPHYDNPQTLAMVEQIKQALANDDFVYYPVITTVDCEKSGLNQIGH